MIEILQGDITKMQAAAIVNAANSTLLGGGGVDGAIHRAAGPELLEECKRVRQERYPQGLPSGEAVATKAYHLPAKYVIHTVGPIYQRDDIKLLSSCYLNSLKAAEELNCESILFPAISTGAYGLPIELSARTVKEILSQFYFKKIKKVGLVLYNKSDYEIYKKEFG